VGVRLIGCKPRIHLEEVLDTVAVIRAVLGLAVLQDGAQPNRPDPQPLEVIKAAPDALQRAALEAAERPIPCGCRRTFGVVEAIDEQKIYPAVSPILRRGKRARDFDLATLYLDCLKPGERASTLFSGWICDPNEACCFSGSRVLM